MNLYKNKELLYLIILALFMGGLIFILIYGIKIVNPFYDDWLLKYLPADAQTCDLKQHYMGWKFFSKASWAFPFGMYDSLSYPVQTSILNTDSIPLFAIFFKFLLYILPSSLRPDTFQYIGLWMISNFMLQSCFGMLICRKLIKQKFEENSNKIIKTVICVLGGVIFTLMPVLFHRTYYNTPNSAHWLILLCLIPLFYNEELTKKQKLLIFLCAGLISGMIQPYIAVMCFFPVFLFTVYNYIKTKDITSYKFILVYILSVMFGLYLSGGFSMNAELSDYSSFRTFGLNLNSFYNSVDLPTAILKFHYFPSIEVRESFAYLGAGIIFLIIFSAISFIFSRKNKKYNKDDKIKIILMTITILITIIIAFSPTIRFCDTILVDLKIPLLIEKIWSAFRSTCRFVFVANYLILTIILMYLFNKYKIRTILLLLISAAIIQIYDMHICYKDVYNYFNDNYKYVNYLDDKLINLSKDNNKIKILIIDFINTMDLLYDTAEYGYKNNLKLNNFYFAREIKKQPIQINDNMLFIVGLFPGEPPKN